MCLFFQHSYSKRAVPLILKLYVAIVYIFGKFKYWSTSFKNEWVFEIMNIISCLFFKSKTTFWAGSQFYVKMWPAWRKERTLNPIGTRGDRKNYENNDYDDDDDDNDNNDDDDDDDSYVVIICWNHLCRIIAFKAPPGGADKIWWWWW